MATHPRLHLNFYGLLIPGDEVCSPGVGSAQSFAGGLRGRVALAVLSSTLIGKTESHLSLTALSPSCKKMSLSILSTRALNPSNLNVLGESSNRFSNGDVNLSELLFSDSGRMVPTVLLCS